MIMTQPDERHVTERWPGSRRGTEEGAAATWASKEAFRPEPRAPSSVSSRPPYTLAQSVLSQAQLARVHSLIPGYATVPRDT